MTKLGARVLGVLGGFYALVVSLVYTLIVTRRLQLSDLATLTVFNAGYGIATAFLGYATTWYPRILAKEPHRISELASVGLLVSILAWVIFTVYMALLGKFYASIAVLALILLVLASWPLGAYLLIYQQRLLALLGYVSQTIKLGGAYFIKSYPTVEVVLSVNVAMSLPTIFVKRIALKFSNVIPTLKELIRGAPYQTLSILATLAGAGVTYVISLGGGDALLAYNYLLAQVVKAVQPALPVVTLMYGSLLVVEDKLRRALIDGTIMLYIYLVVAAVVAKNPEWYLLVLRPSEATNTELLSAVRLNGFAFIAWGLLFHADTVLKGMEEKPIIGLKDKPAKALMLDISTYPVMYLLTYVMIKTYGVSGLVISSAITSAVMLIYRLVLLGSAFLVLGKKLYLPTILALFTLYVIPIPQFPYAGGPILTTILSYVPNAVILATVTLVLFAALSPPARETLFILLRRLRGNSA